jgi:hypothetical protein
MFRPEGIIGLFSAVAGLLGTTAGKPSLWWSYFDAIDTLISSVPRVLETEKCSIIPIGEG